MYRYTKQFMVYATLIFLAELIGYFNLLNPIYYATPSEIAFEAIRMFQEKDIYQDIFSTSYRVLIAIIFSFVISMLISLCIGVSISLRKLLMPLIDFFRSIPPIVWYPLLLIAFGAGEESRIAVAITGGFFVSCLIVLKGLEQYPKMQAQYLFFLGAKKKELFRDLIFYQSFAPAMTALRTTVSLCMVIIIVTEMLVGSAHGLGNRIQQVQITNNIPDLFASIGILGILGLLLNTVAAKIERLVLFWREEDVENFL